jgi:hypothetical protein
VQRQGSFSQAEYAGRKSRHGGTVLAEMEQVVPWVRLVDRLRRFIEGRTQPAAGRAGTDAAALLLQQWYGLADGRWAFALR